MQCHGWNYVKSVLTKADWFWSLLQILEFQSQLKNCDGKKNDSLHSVITGSFCLTAANVLVGQPFVGTFGSFLTHACYIMLILSGLEDRCPCLCSQEGIHSLQLWCFNEINCTQMRSHQWSLYSFEVGCCVIETMWRAGDRRGSAIPSHWSLLAYCPWKTSSHLPPRLDNRL